MSHHSPSTGSSEIKSGRKFHRDWRVWVGVILMLAAILTYVLTLDDSTAPIPVPPGNPPATPAPGNP